MGVLLEIKAGPMAGKIVGLKTGESVTVGRAAGRAQLALSHDTFMSGVHFAVECGLQGSRVQDRKSSNGTFLNGARIQDAMLANGDEIKGGQTIFAVKIVADAKLASLLPSPNDAPASGAPQRLQEPRAAQDPAAANPPRDPSPEPPQSARPPIPAQPPPPSAMRTDDQNWDLSGSGAEPNAAAQSPAPQPLGRSMPAPVEEPPRFDGVPIASQPSADLPSARANPGNTVENVPGPRSKPPRLPGPPPGVAPYIAEKFAENPAARGIAFSVRGWSFPAVPAEWLVQEGFGLQQSSHGEFPSSVAATEEFLGGITLQQFVESQISLLRGYLRDPKIEPTMPPRVGGADESMAVNVRHSTKDGRELVYRRIYARSGACVGVLTVTTLASELSQVLETLQPLLEGAAFRSTVRN
jgi:hypothetical protein